MESPILIYDHVTKQIFKVPAGTGDRRGEEVLAAQREQIATVNGQPPR